MSKEQLYNYLDFLTARESLRKHSKDVPLMYMWSMDMLQELETTLSICAIVRKQIDVISEYGLQTLDQDLFTDKFTLKLEKISRNQSFQKKILLAIDNWPSQEDLLVNAILKYDFRYINKSEISKFKDFFHQIRKIRNHLAHSFFLENSDLKMTSEGISLMENTLERILFDVHSILEISKLFMRSLIEGLYSLIDEYQS